MIASLPMYDRAETQGANDRLWAGIRDGLRAAGLAAPDALTRGQDDLFAQWLMPDLVFSQTCGFPFRTRLHDKITLVGTPDFGVQGCPPGYYKSVFVAHADDPRDDIGQFDGAGLAFNDSHSQSGWAAPQNHAAAIGIRLIPALQSGSHALSARAVAARKAPIAALDMVTWSLLQDWEPAAKHLKVVGATQPTPGLPYITAKGGDGTAIFAAAKAAIAALSQPDRALLRLRDLTFIRAADYLAVPIPPPPDQIAHEK